MRNNLKAPQLLIILLLSPTLGFSQTDKFIWASFDCSYEGTFDKHKLTKTQLEDTYTLCFTDVSLLKSKALAFTPEEIDKLSIDSLNVEYNDKLNKIENLEIVNSPFWKRMKEERINYLKDNYERARVAILSYKNPLILKQFHSSDSCEYADAIIEGKEKMFSAWEKVANLHCQMNGNPARCFKDIFSDKFNSPQKVIYAQIELMVWGWWNICSIQNIPTLTSEIRINKEFEKLFIKVKNLGCIEGE